MSIDPPISEADAGRWFVSRKLAFRQVTHVIPGGLYVVLSNNDSFTIHGEYLDGQEHRDDLIRRATAADFLRLAMDTLGRDTPEAARLAACLEVFADELEASGNSECQPVREAIR